MSTTTAQSTVPGTGDRLRHGSIHLQVTDVARARRFWGDALGLSPLPGDDGAVRLGAGGRELVVLHPGAVGPARRGHSGLYHVAVHVPTRRDFAHALMRLAAHRVPQSPTDHIFSIATYASDPDGLGLEITFETPERVASHEVTESSIALIDRDGRRRAPTEALDVGPLVDEFGGERVEGLMPAATAIGHVHLHVADIPEASRFYRDIVGFDEHMRMDRVGMADFSAGGVFPHRWAVNVWQGAGAPPAAADGARMRHHELRAEASERDAIARRMDAAKHPYTIRGEGLVTADPSGNGLVIGVL